MRRHRRPPFIYSDAEILALMAQARDGIRQAFCAATYETLIGLLAATGVRLGEAIKLDRADIEWAEGVLLVRESKFNKSRCLPVDESTVEALARYGGPRDELCPHPRDSSFFVSLRRTRLYPCAVQATFRRLGQTTAVGADAPFPPRLYDLRHTMAVRTLLAWYRDDGDVQSRLPALATYLGHRDPVYAEVEALLEAPDRTSWGEVGDGSLLAAAWGYRAYPLDQGGARGGERAVVKERVDRGEADVAGPGAVAALVLEVSEEHADPGRVELCELKPRWRVPVFCSRNVSSSRNASR